MACFAFVLLLAGLIPAVAYGGSCPDQPRLALRLRAPAPTGVTEHIVAAGDIEKLSAAPARHVLMAITYALDSRVGIVRKAAADAAEACSTFEIVVTFGIARRDVFLAHEAAAMPCIRQALLAHENDHNRITTQAAHAFIERRRAQLLQAANAALEPAGDPALDADFQAAVMRMLQQLSAEFGAEARGRLRDAGDTPAALAGLAAACGGALGALEEAVRHGTAS
jgi:hypothetical protein